MISQLELTNFKGVNARFSLKPRNLVCGRNFSGKSAILDAARLVVLNYIPGADKTLGGIKRYASAMPMSVQATVGTNGSAKTACVAIDSVKGKVTKTESRSLAEQNALDDQTKVLFDPSLFFGLKDEARISLACELVQSEGELSREDLRKIISVMLTGPSAKLPDETDEAHAARTAKNPELAALAQTYGEWYEEVFAGALVMNDLLSKSEEFFKKKKNAYTAEAKRHERTAEGLTDLSTLEAELAKLPTQAAAEEKKRQLSEQQRKLTEQISAAEAVIGQAQRFEKHRTRAAELPTLEQEHAAKAAERDRLTAEQKKLQELVTDLRGKHATATAALEAAKAGPSTEPVHETPDFLIAGQPGSIYRVTAEIELRGPEGEPSEPDPDLEPIFRKVISWQKVTVPTPEEDEQRQLAIVNASEELDEIVEQGKKAAADLQVVGEALRLVDQLIREIEQKLATARHSKEELESTKALGASATAEQISAWKAERDQVKANLAVAEDTVLQIVRYDQDRKRIRDAAAKRDEMRRIAKAMDKAVDLIAQKKTELVSGSIARPLAIANKLAWGILRGPLVMEEGEIGMRIGQKFAPVSTLSGAEKAMLFMGLTAGLAARSPMRVLMLDEIATVDPHNFPQLLANLDRMVQDRDIDQYILFGADYREILEAAKAVPELNLIETAAP